MSSIEDYSETKEHAVAMSVRHMMTSVAELTELAGNGHGYLVRQDLNDLSLTYAALGKLIRTLK